MKHTLKTLLSFVALLLLLNNCATTKEPSIMIDTAKTYQEYIKTKTYLLPSGKKNAKLTRFNEHIGYLADGSKIIYTCCEDVQDDGSIKRNPWDDVSERIYPFDKPFLSIYKTYSCKTKKLLTMVGTVGRLQVMTYYKFDEEGKLLEKKEPKLGNLSYEKVLEWADKNGFIDLKERKILKGNDFDIGYIPFSMFKTEAEKKAFYSDVKFKSPEVEAKFYEGKGSWSFITQYMKGRFGAERGYFLSDFGDFIAVGEETVDREPTEEEWGNKK